MGTKQIRGDDRKRKARDLRRQYDAGRSVRWLATKYGWSYGRVHRLLVEAGTVMRRKGRQSPGQRTGAK